MKPGLRSALASTCAAIMLLDAFVIPDIHLSANWPAFQLSDFLLPLGLLIIAPSFKEMLAKWWVLWVGAFSLYMLIPMAINGRMGVYNDYFELYKMCKIGGLYLLFLSLPQEKLRTFITVSFIGLVIINVLHFYNVFNINQLLISLYGDSIHFELFGKDSLGNPAVKRMLGTMGNPNTNALLFLFFAVYFFPHERNRAHWMLFYLALCMVFLCQSRTSLIATAIVLFAFLYVTKKDGIKAAIGKICLSVGIYFVATMLATSFFKYTAYSNSLMDGSALYSSSLRSRWESWGILWKMICAKPIFGYGPYKEYFVKMKLYSENEYLLMWWRYGVVGLLFYLGLYILPLWEFIRKKMRIEHLRAAIIIGVMLVTALTNNPLTERSISILFIFMLAGGFTQQSTYEKTVAHR